MEDLRVPQVGNHWTGESRLIAL